MAQRNNVGLALIGAGIVVEVFSNGWLNGPARNDAPAQRPAPVEPYRPPPKQEQKQELKKEKKVEDEKEGYSWYNPAGWFGGEDKEDKKDEKIHEEEKKE